MSDRKPPWNRTIEHLRRYRHIMAVLMKYGFDELVDILRRRLVLRLGARAIPARVRRAGEEMTRPQRARLALEELGHTFVKLGQLLSTRPDMVPAAYIEELELLQDAVEPVDFKLIRAEIEHELGDTLENLFPTFETVPIAAGSIAQVHRATIAEGHQVAVKVRRPGIVAALRAECEILTDLAGLIKTALPADVTIDPVKMVAEFTQAVGKEADLANELRNIQRFQHGMANDVAIHVPRTYEAYCTQGVLTMEYIDGVKPGSAAALTAAGLDPKEVAARGARFVLHQIFDLGFFHTDPHPGNFLVTKGNVLCPLDFGQVARLTGADRRLLADLVLAILDQDSGRLIMTFDRANMLGDTTDQHALSADLEELLEVYHNMPLAEIPFGRMLRQTFDLMRRHRVAPPAQFTLMLKAMMTIESLGTALDGNFLLIEHLRPYARRLQFEQINPRRMLRNARQAWMEGIELATRMPQNIQDVLRRIKSGQFQMHIRHEHLENLIYTLQRGANRVSFALIIAGLLVGSSQLVTQEGWVLHTIRYQSLGIAGYLIAAILGLYLLISILRGRHI